MGRHMGALQDRIRYLPGLDDKVDLDQFLDANL